MLTFKVEEIGSWAIDRVTNLGRFCLFLLTGIGQIFQKPFQIFRIVENIWFIGTKSMAVVILTGFFTGMVLALQGYYALAKFGSAGMLGSAVALTLIRELGPVLTAIMITARAGSAMAAEIGTMRISEQLDALQTMDINPVKFVFSPRLIASIICFPLLTSIFDVVGIFGGLFIATTLKVNGYIYMYRVHESVVMEDIRSGIIKSLVFAVVVVSTCCFKGYYAHIQKEGGFGSRAVSLATTNAVVSSSVLILIYDYLITYILL
ncbi:MlaE family ABC transporter permease [Desulfotalea psychrophila]|uniref:Related to toluene ABC-transporter, permease protein n=1 Tax=Desulfotalea psychrophila (strain LSv54 / DSM 12343) TaxID=177439 RepID=Q6AKV8_DESPS|nr:ABC transporter permease [Desulfotalea psychrophila]CAG37017.1 related to toluene ABC-transporter, permease protein [Desulfotalea psychrophila LSv54]